MFETNFPPGGGRGWGRGGGRCGRCGSYVGWERKRQERMEGNYDEKKGKNKEEKIEREIPASEEWKYKYETKR